MNNQDTDSEPSRYQNQTREDKKSDQALIPAEDWPKMIGKTVVSKDGLDMGTVIADDEMGTMIDYQASYSIEIEYGDHERISIPKDTIYKFDHKNLYTLLTENEILASRNDDPFSTSIRSYTRD
jgi:hypothetical protein